MAVRRVCQAALALVAVGLTTAIALMPHDSGGTALVTVRDKNSPPPSAENSAPLGPRTSACETGVTPMTKEQFVTRAMAQISKWPGVTNPRMFSLVVSTMDAMRLQHPNLNKPLQAQIPGARPVFIAFIRSDTPISPPRSRPGFTAPVLGTTVAFVSDCGGDTGFTRLFGRGEMPLGTLEDLVPRGGPAVAPLNGSQP